MPLAENAAVYFAPANADAVGIVAEAMRIGAYLIVFYPADRSYRVPNVNTDSEEVLELAQTAPHAILMVRGRTSFHGYN